jgi:multiple sugar transport system ATP-binding protein
MPGVSFERVGKRFGGSLVLDDVTIEIPEGQLVVFAGPSGCGKSTLLRMLAGLEEPTSGTIRIGEKVVNGVPPRDRDIAMVFQTYALYPHMTVAENIGFPLRMMGIPPRERAPQVAQVAGMLGLEPYLARFPRQLSGGQRQRVAMGRAIVRAPAVFLFDEPLSNLDAALRAQIRVEIARLHHEIGTTMIYVTHDQVEAMTLADKIVVLDGGRVVQEGAPMEIYNRPSSLFVAGFIGAPAMNMIATQVKAAQISLDGFVLQVSIPEGPATVGIRPEHFAVSTKDSGEAIAGRVDWAEALGAEAMLYVQTAIAPNPLRVRVSTTLPAATEIWLRPMREQVHLFDSSGRRTAR